MSPPSNGLAVAALVLGIIGVVCGFIPILFILTFILGALGVIFGAIARSKATKDPGIPRKGMATAGLVLGIIALALGVVGVVIVNSAVDDLNDDLDQLEQDLDDYPK